MRISLLSLLRFRKLPGLRQSAIRNLRFAGQPRRFRRIRLEPLEARRTLSATDVLSFPHIADQVVLSGAPTWLGIDATDTDPNAGPLTYSVSVNNATSPSVLQAIIPTGNKSLVLNTSGAEAGVTGQMTFQLFDNLVPNTTQHIESLVNDGEFTSNASFYRVAYSGSAPFLIEGGPAGPTSSIGPIDDEYNPDLQYTSADLLGLAKSQDDTGDDQLFVTGGPQRFLDFNYSIFGVLTAGESVREAIQYSTAGGDGRPQSPITIDSAQIITDTQNAALELKAPVGATGSADVTLAVQDEDEHVYSQTFHVVVMPDPNNPAPYLNPLDPVIGIHGQPIIVQLTATDVKQEDADYFDAVRPADQTVNYALSVDHATGVVVITPPADFEGEFLVQFSVRGSESRTTFDQFDSQTVRIDVINQAQPEVSFGLALTNIDGSPLTALEAGEYFTLHVYAQDLRGPSPFYGVYSAYLDIAWSNALASATGPIQYSNFFPNGHDTTAASIGLIDEAGGSGFTPFEDNPAEVFNIPMRATAAGLLTFTSGPAHLYPQHALYVVNHEGPVAFNAVVYGTTSVNVAQLTAELPQAADDAYNATKGTPLIVNVPGILTNDTDTDGSPLTATIVTQPSHGSVILSSDGGFQYRPYPPDFVGDDSFTYTASDGHLFSAPATVQIHVTNNQVPVVVYHTYYATAGQPLVIGASSGVLSGDYDPDGDPITATLTIPPFYGSLQLNADGSFNYTPDPLIVGGNIFYFSVSDPNGGSTQSFASISVSPAGPDVAITLLLTQPDGSPLTSVDVGQSFVLHVMVQDVRPNPDGVFAAYLDLNWDPSKAVVTGPIHHGADYGYGRDQQTTGPGFMDNAGAFASVFGDLAGDALELFSVPMKATGAGDLRFTAGPADNSPLYYVVFFDSSVAPADEIDYGAASIAVDPPPPGVLLLNNMLFITGSDARDQLNVKISYHLLTVSGTIGAMHVNQSFHTTSVHGLDANLGDGNDSLKITGSKSLPVFVDAGDGNDVVSDSAGAAILFGGEGDDRLTGSSSRDILIGGNGRDVLTGGGSEDIVIDGTTTYDHNLPVLLAIETQWLSPVSRDQRMADITSGTGAFVSPLGVSLQPGVTVFSDSDVDQIFADSGDWIFADASADHVTLAQHKSAARRVVALG